MLYTQNIAVQHMHWPQWGLSDTVKLVDILNKYPRLFIFFYGKKCAWKNWLLLDKPNTFAASQWFSLWIDALLVFSVCATGDCNVSSGVSLCTERGLWKGCIATKVYAPISLGPESKSLKSMERLQRPLLSSRKHNYDLY